MEWSSSKRERERERERERDISEVVISCLVDGCNADLRGCKEYHRRHKVCEAHSKTPKVSVGGRELRFCQQCSRFHSLMEFDEGKRSCRKRLDSHNRRRRKPQPLRNEYHNQHAAAGATLVSFSTPEMVWAGGGVAPAPAPAEMEYEQSAAAAAAAAADYGALSLLSTNVHAPWGGLNTGQHHHSSPSAPPTLHFDGQGSSTGPHQTLAFIWD